MFLLWKEIIVAFLFFLVYAWQDIKTRRVNLWLLLLGAVGGIILSAVGERQRCDLLLALIPGLCLLIMSFCTEEAVGYGDGIAVLVLGLYLPLGNVVCVLAAALGMAAFVSLGRILHHRFNTRISLKKGLPFLGFFPPALCLLALSIQ